MIEIIIEFFRNETVRLIICGFGCAIIGFIGGYAMRAIKDLSIDN